MAEEKQTATVIFDMPAERKEAAILEAARRGMSLAAYIRGLIFADLDKEK